jgi:hypothetical protein
LSAGSHPGLRARLADVPPRFPLATTHPEPVQADACAGDLRRVVGRCPACGVPYRGFAGADTGVIQVDRTLWRAACPWVMRVDAPGACQELQAAWRPKGRLKGCARGSESSRS